MGSRPGRAWRVGVVVLVVANIVALVLVSPHQRSLHRAQTEERSSRTMLEEVAGAEAESVLDVANRSAAVDATEREQRRTVLAADATSARVEESTAQLAELEAQVAATIADIADRQTTLDRISEVLGLQRLLIDPLATCTRGIADANSALAAGDHGGATDALGASTAACAQVRSGAAPPAHPFDFPDPHVVRGPSGRWWAYATNSSAGAVQMISSADLVTWRVEDSALSGLPAWATPGATWAPAVISHAGRWLLFYTVRESASGLQCISVATSPSPAGPFVDTSFEPLVCERDEGGSIDPDPVVDGGRLHLLWKTELDTVGGAAELRGARLDPTGTSIDGPVATLLRAESAWEGRTIEGPAMLRSGGHHLLYSGGSWNGSGYAVGAARCTSVLGPCSMVSALPVLRSQGSITGPGGLSVFSTPAGPRVAFHAWQGDEVGYPANRYLHIGEVDASGGTVVVRP